MESYSVKQIAEMLNTQPETVRRWIRNGKLYAEKNSKKDGHVVTKDELDRFLKDSPKYAGMVGLTSGAFMMSSLAPIPIAGGLAAAYLISQKNKKDNSITKDEMRSYLQSEIERRQQAIKQRLMAIEQIQREIANDQQQITECNFALVQLEGED